MNKKASAVMMIVFEVVIVVVIVTLSIMYAKKLAESETVAKKNIANDMKMMIDAAAGIQADFVVQYPRDMSKYNVIIASGKVRVEIEGENTAKAMEKRFFLPAEHNAVGLVKKEKNLCFDKKDKDIVIRPCKEKEIVEQKSASV